MAEDPVARARLCDPTARLRRRLARARRTNAVAGWALARGPELALAAFAVAAALAVAFATDGAFAAWLAFAGAWTGCAVLIAAPAAGAPAERLPPRGSPLIGEDGVALRREVDRIAAALGAEPPARIALTEELELCLAPYRADAPDLIELRVGAPFLVAMDREAFAAALSHEMAHRARGDDVSNVGAVFAVQRLRRFAEARHGALAAALFAAPADALADVLTWAHRNRRRAQEFAADRAAADLVGAEALSRALALVERAALLLGDIDLAPLDPELRLSRLDARMNLSERPLAEAASFAETELGEWLEDDPHAEHPSVGRRLRALGVGRARATRIGPDAGGLLDDAALEPSSTSRALARRLTAIR